MPRLSPSTHTTCAPWVWATAGALLGLVLALLVFAPARWLTAAVQQLSSDRLLLSQPQGTVWQGSAQLVLAAGVGSSEAVALPGRVVWHVQVGWPAWQLQLKSSCCTPQALRLQATPGWGSVQLALQDSVSNWPAELLTGLGTPWNTVQAKGELRLTTQGLSINWGQERLILAGRAQLEALDMSSRLSTLRPMGSYQLTLQPSDKVMGAIGLTLTTLNGSLELSGHGHWANARWHFEGSASAAPQRQDALTNLLNIIGRRDGARSLITIG
jgi:general secretion pathway protein N